MRFRFIFSGTITGLDLAPFPKPEGCQRVIEPVSRLFCINLSSKESIDLQSKEKEEIFIVQVGLREKIVKVVGCLKSGMKLTYRLKVNTLSFIKSSL